MLLASYQIDINDRDDPESSEAWIPSDQPVQLIPPDWDTIPASEEESQEESVHEFDFTTRTAAFHFTPKLLLGILYLGCQLCRLPVFIADLSRWACLGEIPYFCNVSHAFNGKLPLQYTQKVECVCLRVGNSGAFAICPLITSDAADDK